MESALLRGGEVVHRVAREIEVVPKSELRAPAGVSLVVYDPSGKWAGSVKGLESLARADARLGRVRLSRVNATGA